jgi:hypothetical protein
MNMRTFSLKPAAVENQPFSETCYQFNVLCAATGMARGLASCREECNVAYLSQATVCSAPCDVITCTACQRACKSGTGQKSLCMCRHIKTKQDSRLTLFNFNRLSTLTDEKTVIQRLAVGH